MFDVGFNELVLIFIIGLLVLGPQRLPKVAAEIGKWIGRARRTAAELRRQLEREIELNDIQPPPPPASPAAPTPSSTETQNPFHHMPPDTGVPPPPEAVAAIPTAPPAPPHEPPHATSTAEAAHVGPVAEVHSGSAPAQEAAKAPEPTDRPPHV